LRVPIVPVGLNYVQGHRFRGKVVIDFGNPIKIDYETYSLYATNKRHTTEFLLNVIDEGMRNTIAPTPNYNTLQMMKLTPKQTLQLDKRIA
jgi:glycerol-3-phosphate O-acyltransferase/dihydroxyacetone phosphate acyltransferase